MQKTSKGRNSFLLSFLCLFIFSSLTVFVKSSGANSCQFGYSKRVWYVGGNFSTLYNCDGTEVPAENFGIYNGYSWKSMPSGGTNGKINSLFYDKCMNLFIGGEFTHASGNFTGPIAMLRYGGDSFSSLPGNLTFENIADYVLETENKVVAAEESKTIINSISVDCKNIPTSLTNCNCDIYIGGQFVMKTRNPETNQYEYAVNLARYNSIRAKYLTVSTTDANIGWEAMGGKESTNFSVLDDHVKVVNKKNFGIELVSNYLYFGGEFSSFFSNSTLTMTMDQIISENTTKAIGFSFYDLSIRNSKEQQYYFPPELNFFKLFESVSNNSSTPPSSFQNVTILENSKGIRNLDVHDVFYDPSQLATHSTLIAGDFQFKISETEVCTSLCEYDHTTASWRPIKPGFSNDTIDIVTGIDMNDDDIIVSIKGKGLVSKSYSAVNDDSVPWTNILELSKTFASENKTIQGSTSLTEAEKISYLNSLNFGEYYQYFSNSTISSWYLCQNTDLSCSSNSVGFVVEGMSSSNPYTDQYGTTGLIYFDHLKQQFFDFGQGCNGEFSVITSSYDYYGSVYNY